MDQGFYLPENPAYTILDSARDSVRFVTERSLTTYRGHVCAKGSFLDVDGQVMGWHDFGHLEGPGWAANAVGGAYELYRFGLFTEDAALQQTALSLLDHVLEDGFVDPASGFIIAYRETTTDRFCLNFKHHNDWFCPGSMAQVACQLLTFSDFVPDAARRTRMRQIAGRSADWLAAHVSPTPNGWFPRRCTPNGQLYPYRAEGGEDPLFQTSADGLFIVQLWAELARRGQAAKYLPRIRPPVDCFLAAGGFFGSINHDTYDAHENVAYAVAFRTLRLVALVEEWGPQRGGEAPAEPSRPRAAEEIRRFAYDVCLAGLNRFKMAEDRNGVATKGLLWMEESWDTAYLWENAEAALAWLEAAAETGETQYVRDALTVLRAMAKHHHGEYGFLTEGVDWNNHVGAEHHFPPPLRAGEGLGAGVKDGAEFGDIRYTEPLLNNLHLVEPTLFYLTHFARRKATEEGAAHPAASGVGSRGASG